MAATCARKLVVSQAPRRSPALVRLWDKKQGVWRVAEDAPDSDLYAKAATRTL
jgi:hypothetical protein